MLMIAPEPCAFITGTARLMHWNMPLRLTSITRCHSSSPISSTGARGPLMPALFTRTSSPPRAASPSSNQRATAAAEPTSAMLPDMPALAPSTSPRLSSVTQQMWTRAPAAWKRSATARPMLRPAPVTITACEVLLAMAGSWARWNDGGRIGWRRACAKPAAPLPFGRRASTGFTGA